MCAQTHFPPTLAPLAPSPLTHSANGWTNEERTLALEAAEDFTSIHQNLHSIITDYRYSHLRRQQFADVQAAGGESKVHTLQLGADHKFNYWDIEWQRALLLRKYIGEMNPVLYGKTKADQAAFKRKLDMFEADVPVMVVILPILNMASEVIAELSSASYPTISRVLPCVRRLIATCDEAVAKAQDLDSADDQERASRIARRFASSLRHHFSEHTTNELLVLAEFLDVGQSRLWSNSDVAAKVNRAWQILEDKVASQHAAAAAAKEGNGDGDDGASVASKDALAEMLAGTDDDEEVASLGREKKEFLKLLQAAREDAKVNPKSKFDTLLFYKEKVQPKFRVIAAEAREILGIPATSVSAERLFSRVKIVGEGRDGLDPARLGRLVVGAQNAKRLREAYPDWRAAPEDLEEEGASLEDGAVVKIEGEAA